MTARVSVLTSSGKVEALRSNVVREGGKKTQMPQCDKKKRRRDLLDKLY